MLKRSIGEPRAELCDIGLSKVVQSQGWTARYPNGWCVRLRIEKSGLEPRLGHYVVFLRKTLNSHSASLHPVNCQGKLTKCCGVGGGGGNL